MLAFESFCRIHLLGFTAIWIILFDLMRKNGILIGHLSAAGVKEIDLINKSIQFYVCGTSVALVFNSKCTIR